MMVKTGGYKLSDAVRRFWHKARGVTGTKLGPTPETAAEQLREARESDEAGNAGASSRDRMVDIGRGNQQAGRQGQ